MRKTLKLVKREYRAAVRTKGFIIGLVLAPVVMGGSAIGMLLFKDRVDTNDKRVAVIDHTGIVAAALVEAAELRNESEVFDEEKGKKVKPAYLFEVVEPDASDPAGQRLKLSDDVRAGRLHGFLEIGPDAVHPGENTESGRVAYYAENAVLDGLYHWLGWPINLQLRKARVMELGIPESEIKDLFSWNGPVGMGLVSLDAETGQVSEARRSSEGEAFGVPFIMALLLFMMMMMGAMPLLSAVMEEKTQRIAEVLLGSVKPFQFMMGKVLGGLCVSLTCSTVYVVGGVIAVRWMGLGEYVPYHVLPWFFTFMMLAILMQGSILAAFGAACNDAKEAQSLTFPAMLPMLIPMFILTPIVQQPETGFATGLSLVPPFTPMLMLLRMSTPVGVPSWQPWAGLCGILLSTAFSIWAGGRIFRVAILMQGKPPKIRNLVRWALRG